MIGAPAGVASGDAQKADPVHLPLRLLDHLPGIGAVGGGGQAAMERVVEHEEPSCVLGARRLALFAR